MSKKRKKTKSHTVAPEFPSQGTPMDVASHPLNNLPAPAGGAMSGQVLPGAPMLPGEPME